MRPFFPYYGSKWNIARHYPKPMHDLVVEPFAGGAGYATFYDCKRVHLIDADPIIAGLWSYLIKATVEEILALPEMPEVGDNVDNYDLPQEAKWLIGFWLNRGSATPKKSRTAYSARTDRAQLNWSQRATLAANRFVDDAGADDLLSQSYIAMRDAMSVIDANEGPGFKHSRILNALADARVKIENRHTALRAVQPSIAGEPVAWLIDPGAGSAMDKVVLQEPLAFQYAEYIGRGGSVTPLYTLSSKDNGDGK